MSVEFGVREGLVGVEGQLRQPSAIISGEFIPYLLVAIDILVIVFCSVAGGTIYQFMVGNWSPELTSQCAIGLLAGFIYTLRMNSGGIYDLQPSAEPQVEFREILTCWLTTGLVLSLVAFLLKIGSSYSRGSLTLFYFLSAFALLGVRKAVKVVLAKALASGAVGRHDAILIGDFDEMSTLTPGDLLSLCGAAEVSRFALSSEHDALARSSADIRILDAVTTVVRRQNCRQILLAVPWSDVGRIEAIKDRLKSLPVAAQLLPDRHIRSLMETTWSVDKRRLALEFQREPLSIAQRFVKRSMDISLATSALVFCLPVIALAAITIKLDSKGPIIFRQLRKGFNGKHFVIFKFRTMSVQENGPSVVQATRDDSRVTAVGRFLRSSSIDELPQLLNVLRGEMSLVGPRPHALAHDDYFESVLSDYAFRHHVKPGITGWAQCNGARGGTPTIEHVARRVKLDLWYVDHWSIWLDFFILIKTAVEVLRKRNAY